MRVLALDIGTRKTGIALSSLNKEIIFPLERLLLQDFKGDLFFKMLKKKIFKFWSEIDTVVIGKVDENNSISNLVNQVVRIFKSWTDWKVITISEHNSSVDSRAFLKKLGYKGKKKSNRIDSYSALLFLFDFFRSEVFVSF